MNSRQQSSLFFALAVLSLVGSQPVAAQITPFDISNSKSRPVEIWTDSVDEPSVIHGNMVPSFTGLWTSVGTTGTITVPATGVEAFIVASGATPVSGSASDYTIKIDTTTGAVLQDQLDGKFTGDSLGEDQFKGEVQFEYALQSTLGPWTFSSGLAIPGTIGGFQQVNGFPLFASDAYLTGEPDYTVVPAQPYDPTTGFLNAVGPSLYISKAGSLVLFDKGPGDIQLTEAVPEPSSPLAMLVMSIAALVLRRLKNHKTQQT